MRVALITGASRGIGEATAVRLAERGVEVVINYRDKRARAERVATRIRDLGGSALLVQADLTDAEAVAAMVQTTIGRYGRLDLLVLNASGGLEADMPPDYAMRLNRDAQVRLADLAADQMPAGSRIVFVTSHEAHFLDDQDTLPEYAPVAASKHAGEKALLARAEDYAERGIGLVVVSGDLIDGTITAKLLDRVRPGLIESRRSAAGYLPTVDSFAAEIVDAALAAKPVGLVLVGARRDGASD
ncbi:MAG TPA: SDR family oxidoreductase [Microlunatus sp.]